MNIDILLSLSNDDPFLRANYIGSSDAPIIMGDSPWCTPLRLYHKKIGNIKDYENKWMTRGKLLENEARKKFEEIMRVEVKPLRIFSSTHQWMMASVDGISVNGKTLLEIKCPGKHDHLIAMNGDIPKKYYAQLQHQMLVCDLQEMYYFSYSEDCYNLVCVQRDDGYCKLMIDKEEKFFQNLINRTPPRGIYISDDNGSIEDLDWESLSEEYKAISAKIKELECEKKILSDRIIQKCDGKNCRGNGISVFKASRKGTVNYQKIITDLNVDVNIEEYRSSESEFWTIREEKDHDKI